MHIDNKKTYILILAIAPTQRLDDAMLTAETKYFVEACIVMGATVFYLLMLQKYTKKFQKDYQIKKCCLC